MSERLPIRRGLTAWVFLGALGAWTGAALAWGHGALGYGAYLGLAVPSLYLLAICCHDSIHHAAHDRAWLNGLVGWVSTFAMGGPWWLYKRAHLLHHAKTDRPEDPELYVQQCPLWQLPVRFATGNLSYYRLFPKLPRREKVACLLVPALSLLLVALAPAPALLGWLVPMQIAAALFAINTVYLPHGVLRPWVMTRLPVVTGYHDDHHARPAYPWHQYPALHASRAARAQKVAA